MQIRNISQDESAAITGGSGSKFSHYYGNNYDKKREDEHDDDHSEKHGHDDYRKSYGAYCGWH